MFRRSFIAPPLNSTSSSVAAMACVDRAVSRSLLSASRSALRACESNASEAVAEPIKGRSPCPPSAAPSPCSSSFFQTRRPASFSFRLPFVQSLLPLHSATASSRLVAQLSTTAGALFQGAGKAHMIDQVWEEYFADRSQWWDNRIDKRNPKSPDFKHKVTKKALWIDGWSTPPWVKAMLKSERHVGYESSDCQATVQSNRLPEGNVRIGQSGSGSTHMQSARTISEALVVLKNCLQQGIFVDSYMYVEVLKRCLKQRDLIAAKQVHDCIVQSKMDQHLQVANNLLMVYVRCGRLPDARRVFDELVNKNVISWNVMLGGYAQHNLGKDAMELFDEMCQEGVQPDEVSYVSILKACGSPSTLRWGKEVHECIRRADLESGVRVGTALVQMYAKCGCIKQARKTFDKLTSRNVISWNVMIKAYAASGCGEEAYQLFLQMKQEGFKPNAITFMSILNASASVESLQWVRDVHSHVVEAGLGLDLRLGTVLVHMYAKSGSIDEARLVFDRMEEQDVVSWTAMIAAYAESGCGEEAYRLLLQMKQGGFKPNAITFLSILNSSASRGSVEWVKDVHSHVLEAGLGSDLRLGTALVHMYAKSGSIDEARLVFDRMLERDVVLWNAMIGAYAKSGCGEEAYRLLLQMKQGGFKPDAITFLGILNTSASVGSVEWVKDVHSHVLEAGLGLDLRLGTALVHMYAKSGSIDEARLVFDRMEERDVVSWTAMIAAYAESGCGEEAYRLLLQMKQGGFKPDAITFLGILNASASVGSVEWVKDVHGHVLEAGLGSDLRLGNALVHMYAKKGNIDEARLVFERMEERNVVSWTAMIGGLAQHGCGYEALEVFKKMNANGVKPDSLSFVAVLSACSHAGLVDEGRELFLGMAQDYGIVPDVVHYSCMVDLLGRAGHLEEARLFIGNMPLEPDEVTWGALLGACRAHGNVELGELAAKECMKLKPMKASTYVLLSNIYAAAGKWEEVSLVRTMMQERGIRKEPGRSWIAVENKIHEFLVGDTSHPETKEIYAELSRLTEEIKAQGYVPDTRLVLRNIDEEDKEFALCSHSEKLAIAYGLICTPRSKIIRVYKNLRVCSDCHAATKLISKVTRKEIVVRDANRFHHFKDGLCSCKDYW